MKLAGSEAVLVRGWDSSEVLSRLRQLRELVGTSSCEANAAPASLVPAAAAAASQPNLLTRQLSSLDANLGTLGRVLELDR
jgi:hypothetical protein